MKAIYALAILIIFGLGACTNKRFSSSAGTLTTVQSLTHEEDSIFNIIKEKDSLLFQIGFNQIDTSQVKALITANFEFYHDEHGVTDSKRAFIHNIDIIRDLPFKTWRTLVTESMEVFPLYKNNSKELYGAIQNGVHEFYQQNEGEDARKTNTARFTHLWIIENGKWKLKRVLSYDHQDPE